MERLRCAVIGLGRLGWRHAVHLKAAIPQAHLVAVSDTNDEQLGRFIDVYSDVKPYSSYQDLLQAPDIDAVVIASSTNTHTAMVRSAIKAKKAIFCEKPLSMELSEALEIQAMLSKERTFFQLGFMRRFDPAYTSAMNRIERGDVGSAISLRAVSRDPGCPPLAFAKSSGGLVMDLCVHDLDLCRWFSKSEATEIYARGSAIRYPELGSLGDIDHVDITLTFANGFLATVEGSRNSQYGYDVRTEIVCTQGALFVGKLEEDSLLTLRSEGVCVPTVPGFLQRFETAYRLELEAFVSDVLENRQPSVGVEDGIHAQRLAEAANQSLVRGKPIRLTNEKEDEQ
ncbi:Gfo/Idh/MocA family oxidoreductase [Sphaerochaeta sp.]|uniref:Gfo/Idh/MocA family oxidoreductase n=1 Tax=Sphaerochaeta sp. TaxID=1972642 RepID=UPI0025888AC6|nr:Gfo/Idh/MocA family oxidoreductase [Sphaerochaeta sp.]MDD2394960.1 Gfo/Idh/MocA family oxidoreductase [Sphaerochaeta sp.]MDD3456873.1 Gfo/Idh/MocA family oxidoreductase [Sphaerochaeta sp.]